MKTISSLLTIAEAATGQIEVAFESDRSADNVAELQERAAIAIELLNNLEAHLMTDAALAEVSIPVVPTGDEIERLFGT